MSSPRRLVLVLAIAVGAWATWRRLRFDAPLSTAEWRADALGPDDLAG
ncbi:hypothetical protein LCL87_07730 [Rhodococcus hoagii]|nr:hypothetical protein [Prescottella equi]